MKNNSLFSLYFITIIALSAQNMNAAECKQCMVLQNDLLTSLIEQTRLTNQNIKLVQASITLSNEYDKLERQYDKLANLNEQLIQALSHVMSVHNRSTKANGFAILLNEYTPLYFSNTNYATPYRNCSLRNRWIKITLSPTDQSAEQ